MKKRGQISRLLSSVFAFLLILALLGLMSNLTSQEKEDFLLFLVGYYPFQFDYLNGYLEKGR